MEITSLSDALKTLAQSLQLSTVFPAAVFWLINVLFIFPKLWPKVDLSLSNVILVICLVVATTLLSYTLYAFNGPLIRLLEGYVWPNHPFLLNSRQKHLHRFKVLMNRKLTQPSSAAGREALQKLENNYPSKREEVLATALGNTIASFEDYPYMRYGIDAVVMWPRLVPILQRNSFIESVGQQKAVFDFLMNMMFATFICGAELTYLAVFLHRPGDVVALSMLTFILTYLFYRGSITAAARWGVAVRVAFDLYRGDLWNQLHLKPVTRFQDEVKRWEEISLLIGAGSNRSIFDEFVYEADEHSNSAQLFE